MKEIDLIKWLTEEVERQITEAEQQINGQVPQSYYDEMNGYIRGLKKAKELIQAKFHI